MIPQKNNKPPTKGKGIYALSTFIKRVMPCSSSHNLNLCILSGSLCSRNLARNDHNSARKPLEDQINNPQLLEEDDITIAHERSIADVIQGFPEISSSRGGGFGQTQPLNIRGASGQGVVTLDDLPLLQSVPGFLNLDTLPSEAIQKAEIERGPSAAYHSFQALGGAIRLYTLDRQDTGGKLSVEGGSFGILRETLQSGLTGKLGRMTVTLSRADAFDGAHLANSANNPES